MYEFDFAPCPFILLTMTRFEYWALSAVALLLSAMLLLNYYLAASNASLNNELAREQMAINNARQLEPVLDRLAKRIAKGSENDPQLLQVLKKHGLQVTLDVDGKKKNYP